MTINEQRSEGQPVGDKQTVEIGVMELITLMAEKVAQKVGEEIRENDIAPLLERMSAIELKQVAPNPEVTRATNANLRLHSMFEGAWKLSLIALTVIEAWHYLKH